MRPLTMALTALAMGGLALGGAAEAHPKKHKHKHHKHRHAERVVVVPAYAVGQRLPRSYYSNRTYYVQPQTYHLPPAPFGYKYVRVGNAVYLTQTETGMISQVITSLLR